MKTALKNTTRTFGIELEVIADGHQVARNMTAAGLPTQYEGYNHRTRNVWKVVYDASVSGGCELVSPPLKGIEGLEQIETACRVLNEMGARVNRSCGFHVHHDARDFKVQNLRNVVQLYAAYESEIDKMMPASRRGNANGFLRSLKQHACLETSAHGIVASQNVSYRTDARYTKVNVNAFTQHGTVEFRQHSGTVDAEKVIAWVILTQRMMERCKGTRKAPTAEQGRIRNILQSLGIRNCAGDQLEAGELALRNYVNARREYFRTQTRREARRATRSRVA